MKVVFMAPYIFDNNHPEFTRNATGFGYMVKDIIEEISKNHETTLITHVFTEGYIENYKVPCHKIKDVFLHIRFGDIVQGLYYSICFNQKIALRLRYLYYFLDKGYARYQLKRIKPDIVHIHGGTYQTKPYIDLCRELNIPFIITLHGLNGVSKNNLATEPDREYEYTLLKFCAVENIPVTVVSSGCKEGIEKNYNLDTKNVEVILNGTDINDTTEEIVEQTIAREQDEREYNLLVVGNISYHKNQLAIIEALNCIPEKWGKKIQIYICGGNSCSIPIVEEIKKNKYSDHIHYKGFVERSNMEDLWRKTDLNIVASIEEGFGLSIIEGFSYGIPSLTFEDLEAVHDLYHKDAMLLIDKRDNPEYFSLKIIEALEKKWDHNFIRMYSRKFSMEKIGKDYEKAYGRVIKGKKNEIKT